MSTAYGNNAHKKGRGALVDENLKRRFELNAGRARRNLRLWLVPRPSLKPLLKPDTDGMYHFESFQCQRLFGKMLPDLPTGPMGCSFGEFSILIAWNGVCTGVPHRYRFRS
jgi:hypothetical protein